MAEDYNKAVNYLKTQVLHAFPPKVGDGVRKCIGDNSPRRVGKAARKGGGTAGPAGTTTFNGIECSNTARDFTDAEWTAMGDEGRKFVRSSPLKRRQNKKSTSPKARRVSKANSEKKEEAEEEPQVVEQVESSATKGGKAGSSFGKNPHGKTK